MTFLRFISFILIFEILIQIRRQILLIGLEQSEGLLSLDLQNGAKFASENIDAGKVLQLYHAGAIQDTVFYNGS